LRKKGSEHIQPQSTTKLSTTKIILASASPRRSELLQGLGLTFHIHPSEADEAIAEGAKPDDVVKRLSLLKAQSVSPHYNEGLVIGSDTIVVCEGSILGKPRNDEDALRMLSLLQGRSHFVYSGLAIVDAGTGKYRVALSRTEVWMKQLTEPILQRYILTGEPHDKAGSYAIQGYGATLVERIDGDYFTVVGLPLRLLSDMLVEFDVHII
jgi:septum formation protein